MKRSAEIALEPFFAKRHCLQSLDRKFEELIRLEFYYDSDDDIHDDESESINDFEEDEESLLDLESCPAYNYYANKHEVFNKTYVHSLEKPLYVTIFEICLLNDKDFFNYEIQLCLRLVSREMYLFVSDLVLSDTANHIYQQLQKAAIGRYYQNFERLQKLNFAFLTQEIPLLSVNYNNHDLDSQILLDVLNLSISVNLCNLSGLQHLFSSPQSYPNVRKIEIFDCECETCQEFTRFEEATSELILYLDCFPNLKTLNIYSANQMIGYKLGSHILNESLDITYGVSFGGEGGITDSMVERASEMLLLKTLCIHDITVWDQSEEDSLYYHVHVLINKGLFSSLKDINVFHFPNAEIDSENSSLLSFKDKKTGEIVRRVNVNFSIIK